MVVSEEKAGSTALIHSVSSLTRLVRAHLESRFDSVWVEGEISNLKIPSSGHLYMTLKDEGAQLRCVLFRSAGRHVRFTPQNGQKVLCRGRVTVYEPRGDYQLLLETVEPRGIGALQLAFEQLKERLQKEGLFDPARKKPLPVFPRRIGIVTSATGAALRDILHVLNRRFANLYLLISPVPVQGEGAAAAVAEALDELNRMGGLDVLIVARGGGSLEDLWAFNEEPVARAIARSAIPVISAVGHEVDYTISDFVADLRAPTPSAAAELVVRTKKEIVDQVEGFLHRMATAMDRRLETAQGRLDSHRRVLRDPRRAIEAFLFRLDELDGRIRQGALQTIRRARERLSYAGEKVRLRSPRERLSRWADRAHEMAKRIELQIGFLLQRRRDRLESLVGGLESLSPLSILARGYSITRRLPEETLLKDARLIEPGGRISVRLHRGVLLCRVEEATE